MIFSKSNHIEQIISGEKTQTRRLGRQYNVGQTYAIQPGRGKHGIPGGRVLIIERWEEWSDDDLGDYPISEKDALAEGGYTSSEYEALFEKMYPEWRIKYAWRTAYEFAFVPKPRCDENE